MKKKIAFMINSLRGGGAGRVISNLSLNLSSGYEVSILLNDTEEIFYPYKGELIDLQIKRPENMMSYRYQIYSLWKRIVYLYRIKKEQHYDAYISFMDSANIANLITGKRGAKLIVSLRGSVDEHDNRKIYQYFVVPVLKKLYKRSDYIVTLTEKTRESIISRYGLCEDKVVVIPNGYNTEFIKEKAGEALEGEEARALSGEFVIAAMGRLAPEKGYEHLIRAMGKLQKQYEKVKLIILGEGPLRGYLQCLVDDLELKDTVILMGSKKNPFRVLNRARLFVMTSLREGFPNALAEAMCCGLPCVATDFSGARDLLMKTPDYQKEVSDISYEKYGVLIPVCKGECRERTYQTLTREEELLCEAMAGFVENQELVRKYRLASEERIKLLEMKQIIGRWEELLV